MKTRYAWLYGFGIVPLIWALDALTLKPLAVGVVAGLVNLTVVIVVRPKAERRQFKTLTLWVLSSVGVGIVGVFWPRW